MLAQLDEAALPRDGLGTPQSSMDSGRARRELQRSLLLNRQPLSFLPLMAGVLSLSDAVIRIDEGKFCRRCGKSSGGEGGVGYD